MQKEKKRKKGFADEQNKQRNDPQLVDCSVINRTHTPQILVEATNNRVTKSHFGNEANFRGFFFPQKKFEHNFLMREISTTTIKPVAIVTSAYSIRLD